MAEPSPEALEALPDEEFRREVRDWVRANLPPELRDPPKRLHLHENRPWYERLSRRGWLAPAWPREHGGMGLSPAKTIVFIEEMERAGAPRLNDMGVTMIGPLLLRHGTAAQKARFLPRILSGEDIWCQGYSEPEAGSDLASLRTEAVLDGDDYVVRGQKTWCTLGTDANWIFLLVRTDKAARKQDGISFLLVKMDSPGITVRPIVTLDMHDEFAEVFFDDVRVPRENMVGPPNGGWGMAKALLGFERIFFGSPRQSAHALARLRLLGEQLGRADDPVFADRYARLRLDLEDLKALYGTYVERLRRGESLPPGVSMLKVFGTELCQRITDAMLEVSDGYAGMLEPIEGRRALHPGGTFIQARPFTIYGGSSEIQRGIVARDVLDLPGK